MSRILLVEDDLALCHSLQKALEIKAYDVVTAESYNQAKEIFCDGLFQLVILDIQLPDGNGISLCREIRLSSEVPILFLTANDNEDVLVEGLNNGGDDYMTKPFRIKELYARMTALMRRSQTNDQLGIGHLMIDINRQEVYIQGQNVHLSTIDFELLRMLVIHKNQVLTRRQLLEAIERDEYYVEDNTLSVHMKRIRQKLGTYHGFSYIETVRGVGYRINREVLYENK
ncbi:response regulator transcription factor [Candidatus Stoquefichus massiliensis]|uniref:response regulator transcription factor n=1 Tax=Candidatus Stoquefichus massiliensis TaxID=1470350 RepID=UPI000483C290|nr:response regulator transcription factor [Candidatus Stoquefichus massiliensis]